MSARRGLQRFVFLCYLSVSLGAFVFTMTRVALIPRPLMHWSYGMMAPYQTFTTLNIDLVARGQKDDGTWMTIDMDRYYPFGRGESTARKYLLPWRWEALQRGTDYTLLKQYRALVLLLLQREGSLGNPLRRLELRWEEWPVSPAGFSWLRTAPFVRSSLLARVP